MPRRTHSTAIREEITKRRQQTWGFFIYRTCYYDDESRWEEFISRMKGFARMGLSYRRELQTDGEAMLQRLEWHVQQDPELEGCTKVEIWRRHHALMKTLYDGYQPGNVQHCFPIIADREAVDSVVDGTTPENWTSDDDEASQAHVVVLDMIWFDEEQASGGSFAEPDAGGEYGWTKVLVCQVYPYLYSMLINNTWDAVYARPPEVSRLP